MNLPDEQRIRALDLEAPQPASQRRGRTQTRNDRRLLDDKRHDAVSAINREVRRNGHRKTKYTDHVFHHAIGRSDR